MIEEQNILRCNMKSLLLVDDDRLTCESVQSLLHRFGYETETAGTIDAAYQRATTTEYALILVELCLGKDHGTTLVRQLRALKIDTPIAIYTALENELYETAAFDAGADDYIIKTASVPRFIARIEAHIRREGRREDWKPASKRRVAMGRAVLDRDAHVLELDGKVVKLTVREAKILDLLVSEPHRFIGAREIFKRVWGGGSSVDSEDAVHGVLKRLRKKLEQECALHGLIEGLHGKGYRLDGRALAPSA
jgi:DNA-binding response OmpR family regulator